MNINVQASPKGKGGLQQIRGNQTKIDIGSPQSRIAFEKIIQADIQATRLTRESNENLVYILCHIRGTKIAPSKRKLSDVEEHETPSGSVIALDDPGSAVSLITQAMVDDYKLVTSHSPIEVVSALHNSER